MKRTAPTPQMYKAIHLMVYEGRNKKQAAAGAGIHVDTISDWFKNPIFLEAYEAEMRRSLQEIAAEAKQTQLDLMRNAQSENVRSNIAKDFLSRAGYDATTKVENTNREIVVELVNKPKIGRASCRERV